jgi:hypothetical protein
MAAECEGSQSPPRAEELSKKKKFFKSHFNHQSLLSPQTTHLLEKMTVAQMIKQPSSFYGTKRFIAVFTTAH